MVKLAYYALQVITVVGCGVLAFFTVYNDQVSAKVLNFSVQTAYLVALSVISGVLAYKIRKQLKLHNMDDIKKKLIIVEICI